MNLFNTYKIHINTILCRLGIRNILPRETIRKVKEIENGDPIIEIHNDDRFYFSHDLQYPIMLRKEAFKRLVSALQHLPDDITIMVYDAFRPLSVQVASWEKRYQETKAEHSELPPSEIKRRTRLKIADPSKGGHGGHQTGGAVDVTLCKKTGEELNLGTRIPEHTNKTRTKSVHLTEEERLSRRILLKAMEKAGFKNYPGEWWHFSYGDKMWAAYSNKSTCFYGMVKE